MSKERSCLVCQKSENEIPVTQFYYKKQPFHVCVQHIPVLIHNPQELVGLLPDAEQLQGG